jgi:hypothetical protein
VNLPEVVAAFLDSDQKEPEEETSEGPSQSHRAAHDTLSDATEAAAPGTTATGRWVCPDHGATNLTTLTSRNGASTPPAL